MTQRFFKKSLILILILFSFVVSSLPAERLSDSKFSLGISPIIGLVLIPGSNNQGRAGTLNTWLGEIDFSIAQDNHENYWGVSCFPGYLDIHYLNGVFLDFSSTGFWHGYYIAADLINLSPFTEVGTRFGYDIGYRFKFDHWSVNPRIGLDIPLFLLFDGNNLSTDPIKYLEYLPARIWDFNVSIEVNSW